MVEPLEYLAEALLLEIEALQDRRWLLKLLCLPFPDRHSLDAEMRPIADAIVNGRRTKGGEESFGHMEQALNMATALRDKLQAQARPDKWHDRMFAIRLVCITLPLGALLGNR